MNNFLEILSSFFLLYAMYSLASMSGLFSERSGVINIGVEGSMIIGAVWFSLLYALMHDQVGTYGSVVISLIVSIAITALYTQILGITTVRYLADHVIAGTGLNLLAPALAILTSGIITDNTAVVVIPDLKDFNIALGNGSHFSMLGVYVTILAIAFSLTAWFFLNKTKYGLRLKASGENPYALETSGISVNKMKYIAITLSGALAGLAGAIFVFDKQFTFSVLGNGFISIGILIFGQWTIIGTAIGSGLVAVLVAIFQNWVVVFEGTSQTSALLNIIPFVIPILGLMIFKNVSGPSAIGKPFKKDMR